MRIAVLGTGVVGQTLGHGLSALGHEVALGTRDVAKTLEREGDGSPKAWADAHPGARVATFADATADADLVVNATAGGAALEALGQCGSGLDGKPLLDVSFPLDFSAGFPPTLLVKDTDSLAEQIQRAHPEARVVKSLNTVNAAVMIRPETVAGGDHTIFVAGDDEDAKATVTDLLRQLGWQHILDLGDLTAARGLEMMLPLWLRLMLTFGTAEFNFKLVR
jgi:predicted dinucleotide-binding enzyme